MDVSLRQAEMNRYPDVLQEIGVRLEQARSLLAKSPGKDASAVIPLEQVALHLRIVLELVVLGSLVTHREYAEAITQELHKKNVDQARKLIRQVNPHYWPVPVITQLDPTGIRSARAIPSGYLKEDEWGRAYGVVSDLLHARNPFRQRSDFKSLRRELSKLRERLRRLLDEHEIHFVDENRLVMGKLNDGSGSASTGFFVPVRHDEGGLQEDHSGAQA